MRSNGPRRGSLSAGGGATHAGERTGGLLATLARVNGWVAVALFACLTVVVALQVFTRFVLHAPFIWSEELARFLFFWVVLLGSSLSVRQRRHFVIDLFGRRPPRELGRWGVLLELIPDLCVLAFSVLLLVQGIGYTQVGLLRVAPNSQVNMALVYLAIPVFAALTLLYSVGNLLSDVAVLRGNDTLPSGTSGAAAHTAEDGAKPEQGPEAG